jgi:hypothetical protein
MLTPSLQNGGDTTTDTTTDIAVALAGQVRVYLRAYQRVLRHRPTNIQRALMQTAAIAAARYDAAVADGSFSGNSLGHLERCARKSAAAMYASFPKRQPQPELTLGDYLSSKYGAGNDT